MRYHSVAPMTLHMRAALQGCIQHCAMLCSTAGLSGHLPCNEVPMLCSWPPW